MDLTKISIDKSSKQFYTSEIKSDKNYSMKFDKVKNIYSYQIECISKNLLDKNYKPTFPVMSLNETVQNMEIIDMWLNS